VPRMTSPPPERARIRPTNSRAAVKRFIRSFVCRPSRARSMVRTSSCTIQSSSTSRLEHGGACGSAIRLLGYPRGIVTRCARHEPDAAAGDGRKACRNCALSPHPDARRCRRPCARGGRAEAADGAAVLSQFRDTGAAYSRGRTTRPPCARCLHELLLGMPPSSAAHMAAIIAASCIRSSLAEAWNLPNFSP
jgi:hypothetical protein